MRIEYPRGSGLVADYDDHEVEEVRGLIQAVGEGKIPRSEAENACRLIHEAKVHCGARIVPLAESARIAGISLPDPDSPFKFPDSVLADLVR